MVAVFDGQPGKGEADAMIRIVGTLGGAFTGQAVVYGAPPRDVKVSEFQRKDGGGIPAIRAYLRKRRPGEQGPVATQVLRAAL